MKSKIWCATVAREGHGGWWLMNRRETGWSSSVCGVPTLVPGCPAPFPTLEAILDRWDVRIGARGQDAHGTFAEVHPA